MEKVLEIYNSFKGFTLKTVKNAWFRIIILFITAAVSFTMTCASAPLELYNREFTSLHKAIESQSYTDAYYKLYELREGADHIYQENPASLDFDGLNSIATWLYRANNSMDALDSLKNGITSVEDRIKAVQLVKDNLLDVNLDKVYINSFEVGNGVFYWGFYLGCVALTLFLGIISIVFITLNIKKLMLDS